MRVLVDTGVFSASLSRRRRSDLDDKVRLMAGNQLFSLSVAAPIRDWQGTVIAALSVVVPAGTTDPEALAPMVQACARGISRSGWPPYPRS